MFCLEDGIGCVFCLVYIHCNGGEFIFFDERLFLLRNGAAQGGYNSIDAYREGAVMSGIIL